MEPATDKSVLGDFADTEARHFGSRARFFRDNGRFVVETDGKDGKTAAFRVDFTFGFFPLQQYLTTMPDGRVQALPFAWDTRPKEQGGARWFHLYPDEAVPPGDALHWTGAQQNWNYMCADCHSTEVRKGYDAARDRFSTSFSEVSVGCETCHGPGARHADWARAGRPVAVADKGFASAHARRGHADWSPDPVAGSPKTNVSRPAGDEVEMCGVCHARRGQFAEGFRPGDRLADFHRPVLLTPDLFEDDGQMKDEVFNYSSFLQSRMYQKGVVCSDCHEPHGGKLRAEGADVCLQCHAQDKFAAPAHTGHMTGAGSPDCVSCHMPVRNYMVVDPRHDHSFRVPRPDLTLSIGAPNACNDCHKDRTPAWAAEAVERLHGPNRKGVQTYAEAFHAARKDRSEARRLLLDVVADATAPAIARATALSFLQSRPSTETTDAMARALADPDPSVRAAALAGLGSLPLDGRWRLGSRLLVDPVRMVRLAAAALLADGPPADAGQGERESLAKAAAEYVSAERFNADRADARSNLARFFMRQRRFDEAEKEFQAALRLDFAVAPRVDLADLYRAQGRDMEAEHLLRATVSLAPQAAAPRYALGLAMVRARRYEEALELLARASELEPANPRYAYVHAVALESAGRTAQARAVLERALQSSPGNADILRALLQDALRERDIARALPHAERLRIVTPDDANLIGLIARLRAAAQNQR